MKNNILILLFSFMSGQLSGQYSLPPHQLDSLSRSLADATADTNKFDLLMQLAAAHRDVNPNKSVQQYNEAIEIARRIDDKPRLMGCLVSVGFFYASIGEPVKAIEVNQEVLRYTEEMQDDTSMPLAFIANAHEAQGDLDNALAYARRSYWVYEKRVRDKLSVDERGYPAGPMRLGQLLEKMGQRDSAMHYAQMSYRRILEKPFVVYDVESWTFFYCEICNLLGTLYSQSNLPDEALKYYRLALRKEVENNFQTLLQRSRSALAKFYQQANQPDSAIYYATQAYEGALKTKDFEVMKNATGLLRTVFEQRGDFKKALYYNDLAVAARDSVSGAEKVREVQQLTFQEEQRQQAIRQELEAESAARQNTLKLIGSLALLAGVVFFAFIVYRLRELRKTEAMRQAIAADLHDEVGASLTSIQILSQLANHPDAARSAEALDKLPEQVRRTSAALREIVWNIQPKHAALHLLLSQLTRHAGEVFEKSDIQYAVQTDDFPEGASLDPVTRQHFTRIFKEVLSNLVRHSGAGRAAVFIKKENQHIVLVVRDDGKGFDVANVRRGNGLDNMAQRAGAAGGSLDIYSNAGEGTETTLRLPFKLKKAWWRRAGKQ
jgi:signal transduction histidine kinase